MAHLPHHWFFGVEPLPGQGAERPMLGGVDQPLPAESQRPSESQRDLGFEEGSLPLDSRWVRYSLVCHESSTRVTVGASGYLRGDALPGEMLSALCTDGAREAFCAFLMFNRGLPLHLHADVWGGAPRYADYREFVAAGSGPAFPFECDVGLDR